MRKPRISFLIPRLGITDRGAEVFVYELAIRLQADFDVIVWVRKQNNRSELIKELVKKGITIRQATCISENHWAARFLYVIRPLRKTFDKFHINPMEIEMLTFSLACAPQLFRCNIDIMFPVNGVWGALICRIVRAIKRKPFVYTSVGGIEPLIARQKPSVYFAINPGIKHWLNNHFPKLHVEFISTGVDLKRFSIRGHKALIHLPRPIYLTVSALIPDKRVDLTIKAVGRLKRGSLLVIGDGPQKLELMRQAMKYLGKDRFLFQSVGYNRLPEFYRAADVFAFSAPQEVGWGMVHLEALASGLPVIANKEENLEFLLGKNYPLLCNVNNIDEYSKILEKATKIKPENKQRIKNYSWDAVADKYRKSLLALIHENNKND